MLRNVYVQVVLRNKLLPNIIVSYNRPKVRRLKFDSIEIDEL